MTSLFAKLPLKLQVELEPIRNRCAATFARPSAQTIFDDYADTIDKILALGLTHAELAQILFELGLTGRDGKKPKTNSISKNLNRSRQTNAALKLAPGRGSYPAPRQRSPASPLVERGAVGFETGGPASGYQSDEHVLDVAGLATSQCIGAYQNVDGRRQDVAPFRFQCCPLFPGRGLAIESPAPLSPHAEFPYRDTNRQLPALVDEPRQGAATQDKIVHSAPRQGTAALDNGRRRPATIGADDRRSEYPSVQDIAAIGAPGSIKPAAGIAAAVPHAAQAQFPIPPPNLRSANFIRALQSGGLLSKIHNRD